MGNRSNAFESPDGLMSMSESAVIVAKVASEAGCILGDFTEV